MDVNAKHLSHTHQSSPLDSFRRVTSGLQLKYLVAKRMLKPNLISSNMHLTRVVPALQALNLYAGWFTVGFLWFYPRAPRKPVHGSSRRTLETEQEVNAKPLPDSRRNPSDYFGNNTHILNHKWPARPRTLYARP